MTVRVHDGQQINIDISFQYQLESSNLLELYDAYKQKYHTAVQTHAQSTLRDVAAKYDSQAYFHNRTEIEAHMQNELSVSVSGRHATLRAFQVRKIELPDALNLRLRNIELRKQDARQAEEQITLDRILAETEQQLSALKAARQKLKVEYEQETENTRLEIEQTETRIRESTRQAVARINADLQKNLTEFRQSTENQRLLIQENETIVLEGTLRAVANIRAESEERLRVYHSQTENQVQAINRNATIIVADTAKLLNELEARKRTMRVKAESAAAVLVAEAHATARSLQAQSTAQANSRVHIMDAAGIGNMTLSSKELMLLSWIESMTAGQAWRQYVDLATPSALRWWHGSSNSTSSP